MKRIDIYPSLLDRHEFRAMICRPDSTVVLDSIIDCDLTGRFIWPATQYCTIQQQPIL